MNCVHSALSEEQVAAGWTDTGLSGSDVCAVAFSPNYPADRLLIAAVTDETDSYVTFRMGNIGWGAAIANARLNKDNSMPPVSVVAASAAISFPGNYASDYSGTNFLFVAVDTGAGNGDVYRVNPVTAPGQSVATDLNIGSAYGLRNVDVTGLAAGSGPNSTRLMAGAAGSAQAYSSNDSGKTWARSEKAPTGASKTFVLLASGPGNAAYAATSGTESAFSVSQDNGNTWNQAGLIDTGISTIVDFSPSPAYDRDNTMFLLTFGGKHSLWRSLDGGAVWERVFSSALAAVDSISLVKISPRYGANNTSRALFLAGSSNGQPAIWQSLDGGQKFTCRRTADPDGGAAIPIDAWAVVNDTSLFIGGYDGNDSRVYNTTNGGFFYAAGALAGSVPLNSIALSPVYDKDQTILAGDTSPPLSGLITVAFDTRFESNKTVYAASSAANKGIYRFIIGKSSAWESIDGTLPSGGMVNSLTVSADGVLYAANSKAGGGIERSLDPNYPLGPTFDTVTRNLSSTATLTGLWQSGHRLWSADSANAKLMSFVDTLTQPANPTSPADKASGTGSLINHTIANVSLDWESLKEATNYQWQLSYKTDFSSLPNGFSGTTDGSSVRLPTLEPGTTYYWRVRASAPVLSPWSVKRSFTTSLDTEVTPIILESPAAGAAKVSIRPVFQWTPISGAERYELAVSPDADFASPEVTRMGESALTTNSWQAELGLKYDTRYYWRVRAVNASTSSAWSAAGSFTTEAVPQAPRISAAPTLTPGNPTSSPTPPFIQQSVGVSPSQIPPSTVPAAATYGQSPAATPALPTIFNWVAYLVAALMLAIILLLVIILVLVVRMKRA